jgi:hypothetical protein
MRDDLLAGPGGRDGGGGHPGRALGAIPAGRAGDRPAATGPPGQLSARNGVCAQGAACAGVAGRGAGAGRLRRLPLQQEIPAAVAMPGLT